MSSRQQISDPKKCLNLRLRFLDDPNVTRVTPNLVRTSPMEKMCCPLDLQQDGFVKMLRTIFPQMKDKPFDLLFTDGGRKFQRLQVDTLSTEDIKKALRPKQHALYIRLRDDADPSMYTNTELVKMRFVEKKQTNDVKNSIKLRICILENPDINVISMEVVMFRRSKLVQCPLGLREEDFVSQLRFLFPKLAGDAPVELLWTDMSKTLMPLNVVKMTPEEIERATSSVGSELPIVYIRLKKKNNSADEEDATDKMKYITLRMFLIENPHISFCIQSMLKTCQSQTVQFPQSLKEEEFLFQLKTVFPSLACGVPFQLFWINNNRKLMPLKVTALTPVTIRRYIRLRTPKDSALYIQLKRTEVDTSEEGPKQKPEKRVIKKEHLSFSIRIIELQMVGTPLIQSKMVSRLFKFKACADLSAKAFRNRLMKRFTKLRNRPFDFYKCNSQRHVVPLAVVKETAENIYKAIKLETLYIQLKEPYEKKRQKSRPPTRTRKRKRRIQKAAVTALQKEDETNVSVVEDNEDIGNEDVCQPVLPFENKGRSSGNDITMENCQEDRDEQSAGRSDDHVSDGATEKEVKMDDEDLMETFVNNIVNLSCKVCGAQQWKQRLLTEHALSHVDNSSSKCGVCEKTFQSAEGPPAGSREDQCVQNV